MSDKSSNKAFSSFEALEKSNKANDLQELTCLHVSRPQLGEPFLHVILVSIATFFDMPCA